LTGLSDSSTAAPPFCPFLMQTLIPMTPCMNVLHSPSIAYVWWPPESGMVEVKQCLVSCLSDYKLLCITGKASETYKKVLEEVHEISRASLFTPVTRHEAVQAMSKYLCYEMWCRRPNLVLS
jgi:hypothetical protein